MLHAPPAPQHRRHQRHRQITDCVVAPPATTQTLGIERFRGLCISRLGSCVGNLWGLFGKAGQKVRRYFVLTNCERCPPRCARTSNPPTATRSLPRDVAPHRCKTGPRCERHHQPFAIQQRVHPALRGGSLPRWYAGPRRKGVETRGLESCCGRIARSCCNAFSP